MAFEVMVNADFTMLIVENEYPTGTIFRACGHFCRGRGHTVLRIDQCCLDQDLQDYPSCDICRMGP